MRMKRESTMTTMTLNYRPAGHRIRYPAIARAAALVSMWQQRAKQRRQLALLSDSQLDDIGLSRGVANAEAAKPFWRD